MRFWRCLLFLLIVSLLLTASGGAFLYSRAATAAPISSAPIPLAVPSAAYSAVVPILMYHYVETPKPTEPLKNLYVSPATFESQLQEIRRGLYNPVFVSEVAASLKNRRPLPKYSLALSFDDGYGDFYANAWPLLKKFKIKATLYVIINKLDKPGYLTRAQLKELAASDLIEIGAHTFNHPDLRKLKAKDEAFEIIKSKKILEQLIRKPVPTFAYPFGYYNEGALKDVASAGYLGAVSVNPGARQNSDNLRLLNRLRPNERTGQVFGRWLNDWLHLTGF